MSTTTLFDPQHLSREVLHVLAILIVAWLLLGLSRKLIRLFRDFMGTRSHSMEEMRRIDTLARVFRYISSVLVTLIAGMLVLSELGISIAPILGAAGVVGLAVGFGAQSLIKDYFNGFFLLLENQIRQGDAVEVCGKMGVVEDVTLRYVSLRDNEGSVHYIPNGLITTVTNKSRGYGYAVMDVGIAYRESVDEVCAVMAKVAQALRADQNFSDKILQDIEIAGVQELGDSAVIVRCRFKTVAQEQAKVRSAYLARLKQAFDERGIEIPYPHLTVYAGQDKQGKAPGFRLVKEGE